MRCTSQPALISVYYLACLHTHAHVHVQFMHLSLSPSRFRHTNMFAQMPLCTKALCASLLVDSPLSLRKKEMQRDRVIQRVMEKKEKIRVKAKKDLETWTMERTREREQSREWREHRQADRQGERKRSNIWFSYATTICIFHEMWIKCVERFSKSFINHVQSCEVQMKMQMWHDMLYEKTQWNHLISHIDIDIWS